MHSILVKNVKCYAYHGCMEQERNVGGYFSTNVKIKTNVSKCFITDNIEDTIDYTIISEIIISEMKISSNLIEHVGYRIAQKIKKTFNNIEKIKIVITKIRSPIQKDVEKIKVKIKI